MKLAVLYLMTFIAPTDMSQGQMFLHATSATPNLTYEVCMGVAQANNNEQGHEFYAMCVPQNGALETEK